MRSTSLPRRAALTLAALPVLLACGKSAPIEGSGTPAAPGLIVLVVVDQLRGDLVERYEPLFVGGFRRLLDEGYRFRAASHRHAVTETAPGHATLATGVFPSRHGIVGNSWIERDGGEAAGVYAFADAESPVIGGAGSEGRSPVNLRREGIADWVRAADPDARVVSISAKDRSAIPMGGLGEGHVYWLGAGGRFVTSRYYRDRLPEWVERFNRESLPALFKDSAWASRVPRREAHRSRADTAAFEGDGIHTFFPHRFAEEAGAGQLADWTGRTPSPDAAVGALAMDALERLDLGRRGVVDFLAVGFSQTDYVGHDYGPLSREQLDNLLRLDAVLGRLLGELDRVVGRDGWALALSADHGVRSMPEWRATRGEPGRRLTAADLERVRVELAKTMKGGISVPSGRMAAARALEALPFIAAAYTHEQLSERTESVPPDTFAILARNSFFPGRVTGPLGRYGIEIRPAEGVEWSTSVTGTTHGSSYWYDRWVPLIYLGAGVVPGVSDAPAYTVDVAPTLARLGGIHHPDDLDGGPLLP